MIWLRNKKKIFLIMHSIGLDNKISEHNIINIFLSIRFNIRFGCSKEPSSTPALYLILFGLCLNIPVNSCGHVDYSHLSGANLDYGVNQY